MSEIPYFFETPIPKYFRENGWFKNPNTILFINWAFSRCSTQSHKVVMDNKEITLEPFEFIAGRLTSPKECFLTEKQFRGQLFSLLSAKLLKKGANSRANRFTTYIWSTECFSKNKVQQKVQPRANSGPTQGHNQDIKKDRYKEDHHPNPSSKVLPIGDDDLTGLTDDFFSKEISDIKTTQHNMHDQPISPKTIEIVPTVFITQDDLDQCVAIKGSIESVKRSIEYVLRSPGRKSSIYNWPNTLAKWNIKDDIKPRIVENEEMSKRLEKQHGNATGWRCEVHVDRKKDQKGILFYNTASTGNAEPIFVSFIEVDFKDKVSKVLRDKRMQVGRIS
jgi:hypothetical protein